jgi:tetratricopeptide (TPR) repeat protein
MDGSCRIMSRGVAMKSAFSGRIFCLVVIGLAGCYTVKVPVNILHPAEIDLSSYKQVAMGEFSGELGTALSERIKMGLIESRSHFQVLERSRFDQILRELRLSQTDLVDSRYRTKTGRLLGASVLITGRMSKNYQENFSSFRATCKSKERGDYSCTDYTRQGALKTSGSVDVIDLQTGQVLKSKLMNDTCVQNHYAIDETPEYIDVSGLTEQCINKRAADFLRAVSVWSETVAVSYEMDSHLPEMERGISLAKFGDMTGAENVFASVAKAAEKSKSIKGKSIATAYLNLGLTQLYTRQYDKAASSFKRAFKFDPDERYLRETQNVEYMRRDQQKLDSQLHSAK